MTLITLFKSAISIVLFCNSNIINAVKSLTYYNGNYMVYPFDYNNASNITVQLWGGDAVNYGVFNSEGSSGGFIEAEIQTYGNTTFYIETGSKEEHPFAYYTMYNGHPSSIQSTNLYLKAGGGYWSLVFCNSLYFCNSAFGGINTIQLYHNYSKYITRNNTKPNPKKFSKNINITKNFNGTNMFTLNYGLIRIYY